MEEFHYKTKRVEDVAVIELDGSLDSYTSATLTSAIEEVVKDNIYKIILNFSKLNYLSSAGIGIIVEYVELTRGKGGDLKLVSVSNKVEKVLDICGATKIVKIISDENTAIAKFKEEASSIHEKIKFPAQVACPSCRRESSVVSPDIYKCTKCKEIFFVDNDGTAALLNKLEEKHGKAIIKSVDLTIQSDLSFLHCTKKFIGDLTLKEGFSEDEANDIELACDEALTNIVEHAYEFKSGKLIKINISFDDEKVVITLVDYGKTYEPPEKVIEEVVDDLAKKLRKGRGKLLIKKLMDEVEYQTIPNEQNKLVMIKYREKDERKEFISITE